MFIQVGIFTWGSLCSLPSVYAALLCMYAKFQIPINIWELFKAFHGCFIAQISQLNFWHGVLSHMQLRCLPSLMFCYCFWQHPELGTSFFSFLLYLFIKKILYLAHDLLNNYLVFILPFIFFFFTHISIINPSGIHVKQSSSLMFSPQRTIQFFQ